MRLYIVGVSVEAQDRFVDVTFTLEFESSAPQAKAILKSEAWGIVEIGANCVQATATCATVAELRECIEALADVEREVVRKLNEIERIERIAKACAGYYVKQVAESSMWDSEEVTSEEDAHATD